MPLGEFGADFIIGSVGDIGMEDFVEDTIRHVFPVLCLRQLR